MNLALTEVDLPLSLPAPPSWSRLSHLGVSFDHAHRPVNFEHDHRTVTRPANAMLAAGLFDIGPRDKVAAQPGRKHTAVIDQEYRRAEHAGLDCRVASQ